ncbi:ribonucleotide reductase inhibitor [Phlyctema vagabunda]|uniref:Ribonucleotide reductase inhibitor n=1 Tax=Phlyctema vagabunda TaxID=108571 RepID=A0ABR4P9E6_9HELO
MTGHQAKRPYGGPGSQASITSYFSPATAQSRARDTNTLSTPELSTQVQSNLLSVGMRVRKSVPEGYKTGSYSAFTLFSESDSGAGHREMAPRSSSTPCVPSSGNRPRELTPFCGIMKVGGLAVQETEDDWGDMPWASSQESVVSAPEEGTNKRRFLEHEEDEDADAGMDMQGLGNRRIAVPRGKRDGLKTHRARMGQENNGMDFGEAEFLDYSALDEVEMDDA